MAMVGAACLSKLCPIKAHPETQINMQLGGQGPRLARLAGLAPLTPSIISKQGGRGGRERRSRGTVESPPYNV
jgi:hypothetical protein